MSSTWIIEKKLCRCCHAEGEFKNLADLCFDSGNEESYVDMIKNSFFINIVPVPGVLSIATFTICDSCITSVKDAVRFRKQVELCEDKFLNFYSRNAIKVERPIADIIVIKEESDSCHGEDFPAADDQGEHFAELSDCGLERNAEKSDSDGLVELEFEEIVQEKPIEVPPKTTKVANTKKKKKGRPKKTKEGEKKESQPQKDSDKINYSKPKFYLRDGDYTMEGANFKCTRCDKSYDKIYSLKYHVKTKHYLIPRYSCPYCKKQFMTAAPFAIHKLEEHNVDDRFKCNACKGAFNTKVQLRKHTNNFHMLGERYSCEFCEYESFSFEAMYKHKFKHKTSKDHKCRFCKKAFVRKTTLSLHERIHTGDRRKVCKVCGTAFVQKASLNYHMTKYHPEVNF